MGYLCPICEEPFGDAQQCANHLAVTAILHGGPHETWLAEAVADREAIVDTADWESVPRTELATIVADRAAETTDHEHPGDHTHPVADDQPTDGDQPVTGGHEAATGGQPAITESNAETAQLDTDAQAILSEARELTREMQARGPDDEGKES